MRPHGSLLRFLRWPARNKWRACGPMAALGAASLAAVSWLGELASWNPQPVDASTLRMAAILLIVPAMGEEILFRWLLYPGANRSGRIPLAILAIALFVLWHPLQVWSGLGPSWSGLFLQPAFLACVTILGVTLAAMRDASHSLWPPILFHWVVVVTWKMLFGGPF